jgi:hypothetical protein
MFFECAIAKAIWNFVSEFLGYELGSNYISVASKWLQKEKYYCVNIISTAVLRVFFWLIRNDSMFNKQVWSDVKCILRRILKLSLEWRCIYKESKTEEMMRWPSFLEQLIREPLKIRKA